MSLGAIRGMCAGLIMLSLIVSGQDARPVRLRPGEAPKCPVVIVNEKVLQIGRIYDRSRHELRVQFRHAGEGAVTFQVARSTCPCISVLEAPMNLTVFPGDEFSMRLELDATGLVPGPFTRHIVIDFSPCESMRFSVSGECVQPVRVAPGVEMELGSFEGVDVPWKRRFELTTTSLAGEPVSFVEPPASDRFSFRLHATQPGRHDLEIIPKLPMPLGEFHERVMVAVTGLANYNDLQLLVHGQVRGRDFVLKTTELSFTRAEVSQGAVLQRQVSVLKVAAEGARGKGRRRLAPAKQQSNDHLVMVDEQQAGVRTIFAGLADELRLRPAQGVEMAMEAQETQLLLTFSFRPEFFQQEPMPALQLRRGELPLGDIQLRLQ